jgi:hypothetical protein
MDNDDIIKKIAKLINEDEPQSLFHSDDEFGGIPDSLSQLMSQLFTHGWDFTQPADAALVALKGLVDRYDINDVVATAVANDIIMNYPEYQKYGYPLPDPEDGPSQSY